MNFEPFDMFNKRLNLSKDESDSSYFIELLLKGEFLTKIIATVVVSSIINDKERTKYKYEYRLVRGNGIGEWSNIVDEILINHHQKLIKDFAINEAKQLNQKTSSNEWQYEAVKYLKEVAKTLNIELGSLTKKVNLRRWFSDFAQIRNKTRGHGSQKASDLGKAIPRKINRFDL